VNACIAPLEHLAPCDKLHAECKVVQADAGRETWYAGPVFLDLHVSLGTAFRRGKTVPNGAAVSGSHAVDSSKPEQARLQVRPLLLEHYWITVAC